MPMQFLMLIASTLYEKFYDLRKYFTCTDAIISVLIVTL